MSSIQKQKGLLILKKRFLIFLFYIQKNGLSMKSKVSTLDIRIKQSGLMVSHSKVPSSGNALHKRSTDFSFKGTVDVILNNLSFTRVT